MSDEGSELALRPSDAALAEMSRSALVVVTFGKARSTSYRKAVRLAKTATRYQEADVDGEILHLAVFDRTPAAAGVAQALLWLVSNWKSTMVIAGGRIVDPGLAWTTVSCFNTSLACPDTRSYCVGEEFVYASREDLGLGRGTHLLDYTMSWPMHGTQQLPCRQLFGARVRVRSSRPGTLNDQMMAAAVKQSCDWCPHFRPEDARLLDLDKPAIKKP